ncbi:MAG: EamA family transporter [Fibrobacterales bacterium]
MITKIISYSAIYLIWGSTYYFIKTAVTTVSPFYVVGIRFTMGALVLFAFACLAKRIKKRPTLQQSINAVFIGMLLLMGANGLVTIAEQHVDSYLFALMASSLPLVTIFFDWLINGKRITIIAGIGILSGITGVIVLLSDGSSQLSAVSNELWLGVLAIILWALGSSLSKQLALPTDPVINSLIQQGSVGVISLILIQFYAPASQYTWSEIATVSWFSIGYLAIAGSFALVCYGWLLQNEPLSRVMSYTFINPLIAISLGVFIGGEKIVSTIGPSAGLIALGLICMFYEKQILSMIRKAFGKPKIINPS